MVSIRTTDGATRSTASFMAFCSRESRSSAAIAAENDAAHTITRYHHGNECFEHVHVQSAGMASALTLTLSRPTFGAVPGNGTMMQFTICNHILVQSWRFFLFVCRPQIEFHQIPAAQHGDFYRIKCIDIFKIRSQQFARLNQPIA